VSAEADRPLWRIFLHIGLLVFVAQRVGAISIAVMSHQGPLPIIGLVLQATAALVASIAMWIGRGIEPTLKALGAMVAVSAVLGVVALGWSAIPGAIGQMLAAALAIGGLIYLLRRAEESR
jgi:hypothetical protein